MSIAQDPVAVTEPTNGLVPTTAQPTHETTEKSMTTTPVKEPVPAQTLGLAAQPPKSSLDTASMSSSTDPTADFTGDVETDNKLPSQETLKKIENVILLDKDGKGVPFKSLYTGPNVPRRVLVIFIRHFFCGNCQEYIRTLTESISPDSLLQLPTPTFIAVIGCGAASLISMYQEATQCPFPIYADPSKKLYQELGMIQTLALGSRPEYMRKGMFSLTVRSILQELKHIGTGNMLQGGDMRQVGGEFLFEPTTNLVGSPMAQTPSPIDGPNGYFEEEKRVAWCHRMRNTRDHVEIPELREVLGLDGVGVPGKNDKRWSRAVGSRKGTGLSTMSRPSMNQEPRILTGGAVLNAENGVGKVIGSDTTNGTT